MSDKLRYSTIWWVLKSYAIILLIAWIVGLSYESGMTRDMFYMAAITYCLAEIADIRAKSKENKP